MAFDFRILFKILALAWSKLWPTLWLKTSNGKPSTSLRGIIIIEAINLKLSILNGLSENGTKKECKPGSKAAHNCVPHVCSV